MPDAGDAACLLTVHGSLLCFEPGGRHFVHREFHELPEDADIVVLERPAASLRTLEAGIAVPIRIRGASWRGRPRALGIVPSGKPGGVTLQAGRQFLSAGSGGGAVVHTGEAAAWEEFVPVALADLAILRGLGASDWLSLRDRTVLRRSECRVGRDFVLAAGHIRVALRDNPELGRPGPDPHGARQLLAVGETGRVERLLPFDPTILWRSDGSAEAEAELDLGVASLLLHGGTGARVLVETARSTDALVDAVRAALAALAPEDGATEAPAAEIAGRVTAVARPPRGDGILGFASSLPAGGEAGPVLCLSNGVVCDGALMPLLAAIAAADGIVAPPWLRGAANDRTPRPFLADDPREDPGAVDPDPAVIGLPCAGAWRSLEPLAEAIRRRSTEAGEPLDDGLERDLLRALLAATGGGDTRAIAGFVGQGDGPEAAGPARGLRNLRDWPPETRLDLMRDHLRSSAQS